VKLVKTFLSTREYAQTCGLTVQKVTQMLRAGQIAGEKLGNRWRIPADQVPAQTAAPETPESSARPHYTVDEFAAMTYLTPWGVVDWLKTGRLKRVVDAEGNWAVDAACLDHPDVRRILR
jgi:excisionase family DNA binding protein